MCPVLLLSWYKGWFTTRRVHESTYFPKSFSLGLPSRFPCCTGTPEAGTVDRPHQLLLRADEVIQ
jgi:hypothetical protein